MANIFMPITGETDGAIKQQVYELVRYVYEDKIGGAYIGDVFKAPGDVFELNLSSNSGLQKTDNELSIINQDDGGLHNLNDGVSVKIADSSLTATSSGLKVTPPGYTTGIAMIPSLGNIVVVNEASVGATPRFWLSYQNIVTNKGTLWISTWVVGVSFTIRCMNATAGDTNVAWMLVNP